MLTKLTTNKNIIMNNDDWIDIKKDDRHVKRERKKAKELRKSSWWKEQVSKGICYYCNKKISPNEITMDHILPIVRGGKSNKSNCVVCCKDCNNKKKYLTPAEIILKELEKDQNKSN
tara:strand:+ start:398 stop:748 length:351 start_codon:yes stop_codon:yes gene_type:complete